MPAYLAHSSPHPWTKLKIRLRRKRTIKIPNRIRAIPTEAAEIPVNPKTPAAIAITRKISVQ